MTVSLRKPVSLRKARNLNERNRSETRYAKGDHWRQYGPFPTVNYEKRP